MDWANIISDALGVVVIMLVVTLIPILGTIIGKIGVAILNSIKNPTIRHLAGDAVQWAEDKWGSEAGDKKLDGAVNYLEAKMKISHADAEVAIRSAYQNIFKQFPKEVPPAA